MLSPYVLKAQISTLHGSQPTEPPVGLAARTGSEQSQVCQPLHPLFYLGRLLAVCRQPQHGITEQHCASQKPVLNHKISGYYPFP